MLLGGQGIAETKLEFEVLAHLYSMQCTPLQD